DAFCLLARGQVAGQYVDAAAQRSQLVAGLSERVDVAADQHKVSAGLRERLGNRPPQAAAAPRHQRPPTIQAKLVQHAHWQSLSRFTGVAPILLWLRGWDWRHYRKGIGGSIPVSKTRLGDTGVVADREAGWALEERCKDTPLTACGSRSN